jgi:integrase
LAVRQAKTLLRLGLVNELSQEERAGPLTLGDLFRRYAVHGRYLPDGSLKTEAYLRACVIVGGNLARHFGVDFPVQQLTPNRIGGYVRIRRAGGITGRAVGTNTIQRELAILKAVCNWARGVYVGETPLLDRNPLDRYKISSERDPKRPLVDDETVEALLKVADQVHPCLALLITLAHTTGRRIGSILGLRWDDIDFEKEEIHWRAEHDKIGRTWVAPLPRRVRGPLLAYRMAQKCIGSAPLFPRARRGRTDEPIHRDLASQWLKEAYSVAGVEKPDGSLWHAFRRRWATERKDLPLKDVAAAGGWKDVTTLLTCYQHPDEETLRTVMDYVKPKKAGAVVRRSG